MNNIFSKRYSALISLCVSIFVSSTLICSEEPFSSNDTNTEVATWIELAKKQTRFHIFKNGLSLISYHIPENPNAYLSLTVDVGSKNESPGQYGFAHAVEHMAFKGTKEGEKSLSESALRTIVKNLGGYTNAHTSSDATTYLIETDKTNTSTLLDLLVRCIYFPRFDEDHFSSEVKAIINEIKMRNASPSTTFFDFFITSLYHEGHPYYHPLGGYPENLIVAQAEDLRNFYETHYHPTKSCLVVVGDIDHNSIVAQIEHFLEQHNLTTPPATSSIVEKPLLYPYYREPFSQKNYCYYYPVKTPEIYYAWNFPSYYEEPHYAANAACSLLQDRLNSTLKDEEDLVYSVNVLSWSRQYGSSFFIHFKPKKDASGYYENTIKKCHDFISQECNQLANPALINDELNRLKTAISTSFLETFEYPKTIGSLFEKSFFIHRNHLESFKQWEEMNNLSSNDVSAFVKKYLQPLTKHTFSCFPLPEEKMDEWHAWRAMVDAYEQELLAQKMREEVSKSTSEIEITSTNIDQLSFDFAQPDTEFVLDNGLTVLVKKSTTTPFVHGRFVFKEAELFDLDFAQQRQPSLASLAMSMLLDDSEGYTKKNHQQFFISLGAHGHADEDGANFTCLSNDLDSILARIAHMITKPLYPEKSFLEKKQRILDRLIMAQQKDGAYIGQKALSYHLYKEYPWSLSHEEEIDRLSLLTRDDLVTFHKKYLVPSNMFLVVVGNINPATIKQQLNQGLESWISNEQARASFEDLAIPELNNPEAITTHLELAQEQILLLAGRLTTYRGTRDHLALSLVHDEVHKRIFEIREKSGSFYGVSVRLTHGSFFITKGMARLSMLVSVHACEAVKTAIKETLQDLCNNGITEQLLTAAKQAYALQLATSFATNKSLMYSYADLYTNNLGYDYYHRRLEAVKNITIEEVNDVLKRYFNPEEWSFITVGRTTNHAAA